jgi:hypothetical protein
VVPEGGRSGGRDVIAGHSERLNASGGFQTEVVTAAELSAGAPRRYDVGVATWWETVADLHRVDCGRRVVFLQSLEHLWYGPDEALEGLAAALPLVLHDDFVAVSSWLRDAVESLRPGSRCRLVPNGVDKAVFEPHPQPAGATAGHARPLRVLVEGQPTIWLKAIADAAAALRMMEEPVEFTLAALAPDGTEEVGADHVRVGLSPEQMAALYADSDVLLKLSRVEGLGMAPLEAFHLGVPCVVTPYGGHEDYVVHGENGLVVGFDDIPATARWLDVLARDRELLARLGRGATRAAEAWPGLDRSTELLADALTQIADEPAHGLDVAEAGVLDLVRQVTEIARPTHSGLAGALDWHTQALKDARELVHELSLSRDECGEKLRRTSAELEAIKSSRVYRATARARNAVKPDSRWPLG